MKRPMNKHMRRLQHRRGFNLIEFMVTLFLSGLAITGIVVMNDIQTQLVKSQRDTTIARILAESFVAQLQGETVNWETDFDFSEADTPLLFFGLGKLTTGIGEVWVSVPNSSETASPTFNSLGVPAENLYGGAVLDGANGKVNNYSQRYCVQYRLEYVGVGNDLMNLQVRILWPRDYDDVVTDCTTADNNDQFRVVQTTTVLAQNTEI